MAETISNDERRALLQPYGLDDVIGEPRDLPQDLGAETVIHPDDATWAPHFVKVQVRDIEQLKHLAGVPSRYAAKEIAKGAEYAEQCRSAEGDGLISQARRVLFGDWEGEHAKSAGAGEVEKFMLEAAKELPVFAGKNLIVKAGQSVTLSGAPTFYFDKVEVYGDGEIKTEGQIKVIANSVAHIDA